MDEVILKITISSDGGSVKLLVDGANTVCDLDEIKFIDALKESFREIGEFAETEINGSKIWLGNYYCG